MAITISGENNNDRILAQDGVIDQISGINIVGLITASHINVGSNIQLGNAGIITATTFVGNVTGNVNSTSPLLLQTGGSERFRITGDNALGIAGANYGSSGQVLTSGGSGSAVTWSAIPSQVTIASNADNRIITGGSGTNLVGEAGLTYDGTTLSNDAVTRNIKSGANYVLIGSSNAGGVSLGLDGDSNGDGSGTDYAFFEHDTSGNLNIVGDNPANAANIIFKTNSATERLRIASDGDVIIGGSSDAGYADYADNLTIHDTQNSGITIRSGTTSQGSIYFSDTTGTAAGTYVGNIIYDHSDNHMRFATSGSERVRIDTSGSLLIANTTGSRTNLSGNADDIVIGNTSTSNETGISIFSTNASGIRFNDASGTDAAIEYGHSARELRFNSAGANRLQFGINASNSPVFSLGTGHYSGDSNNHNKGDRTSVKVGAYLHLESANGAGHNTRAGLGYNCYFHSLEDFYCGTRSPNSGDNRPAAYGMAYGNHYFYSDASNTAHSAQASLTMTKNMVIHRQGYVTKPNQPIASLTHNPAVDINSAVLTSSNFYSQTWVNQGNHFNASNGRFVCPVAGVYRIYFRATVDQSGHTNVRLRKNGSTINEAYSNYSSGQTSSDSSEAVVNCSANDYLEIEASRLKAIGGTQHKQVTFELMS